MPKQWSGVLATHAQSGGERVERFETVTWNSAVSVQGRFALEVQRDPRDGNALTWRGRGEAVVHVSGRRTTRSKDEVIVDTYLGDYVDHFDVIVTHLDFVKGTYQMAVIRDLWQNQPHRGKAIEHTSIKTNKYGTWTDHSMVNGHSWADDAGAGFGPPAALPKAGLIIDGTLTSNNDDFMSQDGSHWSTTWTIRPAGPGFEEPLKAVAGGPYIAERGQTLMLDGLQSTGRIRSYRWTFEPAEGKNAIPFNSGAAKDGRRVPVVMLAAVKATLTVSDGEKEDSDTVTIGVNARDYATPFVHRTTEKLHPRSTAPRQIKEHKVRFAGGENVCALDEYGAKDSIHILHPAAAAGSWDARGYTLKQVQDPGGPFDGDWFVESYLLRIEREVLMNKYILPGGPPPVSTATPFYETNKAMGHDADGYLAAARRHELMHSQFMQKSLATHDPGPRIEALAYKERDPLKTQADKIIQSAEDTIDQASADPLPWAGFRGPMAFPNDATDQYITMIMEI